MTISGVKSSTKPPSCLEYQGYHPASHDSWGVALVYSSVRTRSLFCGWRTSVSTFLSLIILTAQKMCVYKWSCIPDGLNGIFHPQLCSNVAARNRKHLKWKKKKSLHLGRDSTSIRGLLKVAEESNLLHPEQPKYTVMHFNTLWNTFTEEKS